jgi:hypothetical protein
MIRGRMQVQDDVRAWECDSIELSPITAKRDTISNLHPGLSFVPFGNQSFIAMLNLSTFYPARPANQLNPVYDGAILETLAFGIFCNNVGKASKKGW